MKQKGSSEVTVIFKRAYQQPGGKRYTAGQYARLPYELALHLAQEGIVEIREPDARETK